VSAWLGRAVYCVVTARRSERPTVPPSFDVAQYARDSEARMRSVAATRRPPPLELDLDLDLDGWNDATPRATSSEVRIRPNTPATNEARAMVGAPCVPTPLAEERMEQEDGKTGRSERGGG
jgi:hypothetical protein